MLKNSIVFTRNLIYGLCQKIMHFLWMIIIPSYNYQPQEQYKQKQKQNEKSNILSSLTNTLSIKTDNDEVTAFYQNHSSFHPGDSGYDLFVPEDVSFNLWDTKFVNFQIKCEMLNCMGNNVSYYLYPRSSISKTPLILHNSVGIIDAGYRGNIIAALKFIPDGTNNEQYTLKKGTRICQICSGDLRPLNHQLVEQLSETNRAEGGFGSTGK